MYSFVFVRHQTAFKNDISRDTKSESLDKAVLKPGDFASVQALLDLVRRRVKHGDKLSLHGIRLGSRQIQRRGYPPSKSIALASPYFIPRLVFFFPFPFPLVLSHPS